MRGVRGMRIRFLFKKGEPVRFISHLDMMRTFARAMRRASLPVAVSKGFNPHPRMVFALPLAVGATSEMDVLDVDFDRRIRVLDAVEGLNSTLPHGLSVCVGREIPDDSPPAMSVVEAAEYSVSAPIRVRSVNPSQVLAAFMESRAVSVVREREGRASHRIDVRPLVLGASVERDEQGPTVLFEFTILSGSRRNLRPDELLLALDQVGSGWLELMEARYHRKGLLTVSGDRFVPLV